jgi:hypothetical protein
VNVFHGLPEGPDVATALGLASLMGAGSWSAYMHYRNRKNAERDAEEVRLSVLRRVRYPRLSLRAMSARAAAGPALTPEQAWTQVWEAHHCPRTTRKPLDPNENEGNDENDSETSGGAELDVSDDLGDDLGIDLGEGFGDDAEARTEHAVIVNELRQRHPHWPADTVTDVAGVLAPVGVLPTPAPRTITALPDQAPAGEPAETSDDSAAVQDIPPAPVVATSRQAGRTTSTRVKVLGLREKHPDWTVAKIAKQVGVTERTVRRYLNAEDAAENPAA